LCVADAAESLTAHRPYRPAHPIDAALASINLRPGQWYDQRVVQAPALSFSSPSYCIDTIDMDKQNWLSSYPQPDSGGIETLWNNGKMSAIPAIT
jgi:HD-GYP domain-containing protein (c-di-GMP phosphodiesterase class II)